MSASGVDFERVDDDVLYAGLEVAGELGSLIGVHAENEYVTALLGRRLRAAGRTDRASWHESRPPATELEAIRRACFWAKAAGGRLHVVHVSIADGLEEIARAKREGTRVTAETCPHYLFFDETDFERLGPSAKCAPPLRSRADVEALWSAVLDGLVDTIGSDHSPCPWEDKARGLDDIWEAWGGISGIQTMLPALLTEGVHRRGLDLRALAAMTATNPARVFGLYPRERSDPGRRGRRSRRRRPRPGVDADGGRAPLPEQAQRLRRVLVQGLGRAHPRARRDRLCRRARSRSNPGSGGCCARPPRLTPA